MVVISFIFLICEPGTKMSIQFAAYGEQVEQSAWYLLPIELQRMYMIFVSYTQNPIKLSSYGGIGCERVTSKVVKIVYGHELKFTFLNGFIMSFPDYQRSIFILYDASPTQGLDNSWPHF